VALVVAIYLSVGHSMPLWKSLACGVELALCFALALSTTTTLGQEPPPALAEAKCEEQLTKIPLTEVWGWDIPGTKDVRELEPKLEGLQLTNEELFERSKATHITRLLARSGKPDQPSPGFVVEGQGAEALEGAHAVLTDAEQRRDRFPEDSKASLVCFTYLSGNAFRLDSVSRSGRSIVV